MWGGKDLYGDNSGWDGKGNTEDAPPSTEKKENKVGKTTAATPPTEHDRPPQSDGAKKEMRKRKTRRQLEAERRKAQKDYRKKPQSRKQRRDKKWDRVGNSPQTSSKPLSGQQRQEQLQKGNEQMLDQILVRMHETTDVAVDTAATLNQQTNQMHKIYDDLKQTEEVIDRADHSLANMDGWTGWARSFFVSAPEKEKQPTLQDAVPTAERHLDKHSRMSTQQQMNQRKPKTGEDAKALELLKGIRQLKMIGQDIGNELVVQGDLLDTINDQMDHVDHRVKRSTQKANRIARGS